MEMTRPGPSHLGQRQSAPGAAENVEWAASQTNNPPYCQVGASLPLTLGSDTWQVTAQLKVTDQTTQDVQTICRGSTSVKGVRLYIEAHDTKEVVSVGQTINLRAQLDLPPTLNGTCTGIYTWSCEGAEFQQGNEWIRDTIGATVTDTSSAVNPRFTEPSPASAVTVTYQPTGVTDVELTALRPDPTAQTGYTSDDAIFSVVGLRIVFTGENGFDGAADDSFDWSAPGQARPRVLIICNDDDDDRDGIQDCALGLPDVSAKSGRSTALLRNP